MAESTTFTGNVTSQRTTYQRLTSTDYYSKKIQFACFTKNPFTRVIGAEAFGVKNLENLETFSAARPTGRMVRYDSGVYAVAGSVFATSGTSTHVGRLGNFNPELVEGGDEYKYSWHRLINTQYIPDVDVQDNGKGSIDIKMQKMENMKSTFVEDFNYAILGNSSGPNNAVLGPTAVKSDLPELISVTQDGTRTVGGIAKDSTSTPAYWYNNLEPITSVGGGGDMDRPLILRRKLLKLMNTTLTMGESTGPQDYLILTTQGGHQYYDRLMYADAIQGGRGDFGVSTRYDAAGVQAHAFNGATMIWDPAVTVPEGATASTEAFYGIHIPSFALAIRSEENFVVTPWEEPRNHDRNRTLVAQIRLRYTPMVSAMRSHFLGYNVPANAD